MHSTAHMAVQHTLHGPSCYHGLHDADIAKDLFISLDPEFRNSWSRLDENARIAIHHCRAGTGKKDHELQNRNHEHADNHRVNILRPADDPSMPNLRKNPLTISSGPSPLAVALRPPLVVPGSPHSERTNPFFVYFCDDGEHIDSDGPTAPPWTQFEVTLKDENGNPGPMAPPWTQFEVTLKDKNGNPRLDSKGNPITVIAPLPSELQVRVFLTKTEEHGGPTAPPCIRIASIC
jgi:hypothetical protein